MHDNILFIISMRRNYAVRCLKCSLYKCHGDSDSKCFDCSSAEKFVLKVIPTILFLCAVTFLFL